MKLIFEFGSLILLIRGIFSILNDSAVTERKLPPRCPGQGYVNFLLSRTALRWSSHIPGQRGDNLQAVLNVDEIIFKIRIGCQERKKSKEHT